MLPILRINSAALIWRSDFAQLRYAAMRDPKKRARIILHGQDETLTEMVICLHRSSYLRPHKHPRTRAESYTLLEGRLHVSFYDEKGKLTEQTILDEDRPICRISGGQFHQPQAMSEYAIYHEVYPGPFDKQKDVIYAPWAQEEAA